jgi:hypothetical protein
LLLGYLGVFEDTILDPYLEIAYKLHAFMEAYKDIPNKDSQLGEHLKLIKMAKEELENSLKKLSNPTEGFT